MQGKSLHKIDNKSSESVEQVRTIFEKNHKELKFHSGGN